ncbi:unnamed protein product [Ophioblennius macclurei]
MDSEKTGMAYPEEKSALGQPSVGQAPAPPPYQDQPGQPQPGMGYPQGYGFQSYPGGYAQQPYPAHAGPITIQPAVYVTQGPLTNPVNDYLCYSIFTMVCCCMPLGIAALIYSISAREANFHGNQAEAERSSRMARTLNHVALGIGVGVVVLTIIYVAVVVSVASNN